MSLLENINDNYRREIDMLNSRINSRLESANPLMKQIVNTLLRTKGKQLRPLLLIMCAKMFAPVNEKIIAAAASVELIHNASLIHDDVVDNSMTRRNAPTVNAVWDNQIAVLVGDYFTSTAMHEAISTGNVGIISTLCELGRDLSLGEIDQIYVAREHMLEQKNYFRIIDYKTGSLFIAAATMGCMAAGASEADTKRLAEYARLFGRCFQLRDDIFDYFEEGIVGKPTGNDLREGKVTLPLLLALYNASEDAKQPILKLLAKDHLSDDEIAIILDFARQNGGIEGAYAVMENLRGQAMECLAPFSDDIPQKKELQELFSFIIERQY